MRRRGGVRRRSGSRALLLQDLPASVQAMVAEHTGAAVQSSTRRPKYGNRKAIVEGITFDSQREAARYLDLKSRRDAGEIRDLELQPRYELHAAGPDGAVTVARFKPDFRYFDIGENRLVIEDVKSKATRTTAYMLRKRWFEAEYGIPLTEVY